MNFVACLSTARSSAYRRVLDIRNITCGSRTAVGVLSLACQSLRASCAHATFVRPCTAPESTQRERHPGWRKRALRFSALGPSPNHSTFPLRSPAPQKSPGRISLCARSAARMHVKCIREFPASPLCCRSGADILSAPLTGSPQRLAMLNHAPYRDPTANPLQQNLSWVVAVETP